MIIGIDKDEVLAQLLKYFLGFYNQREGTSFKPEQFHTYRWEDILGVPLEKIIEYTYLVLGVDQPIEPVPYAVEGIQKLREQGHELVVVTARAELFKEPTTRWLDQYFKYQFRGVRFANKGAPFDKNVDCIKNKIRICEEEGIEIMIEDNPKYLGACTQAGLRGILLNYPWNLNEETPINTIRVNSWREIPQYINGNGH